MVVGREAQAQPAGHRGALPGTAPEHPQVDVGPRSGDGPGRQPLGRPVGALQQAHDVVDQVAVAGRFGPRLAEQVGGQGRRGASRPAPGASGRSGMSSPSTVRYGALALGLSSATPSRAAPRSLAAGRGGAGAERPMPRSMRPGYMASSRPNSSTMDSAVRCPLWTPPDPTRMRAGDRRGHAPISTGGDEPGHPRIEVVLGEPVADIAERLGRPGQVDAVAQGGGRLGPRADRVPGPGRRAVPASGSSTSCPFLGQRAVEEPPCRGVPPGAHRCHRERMHLRSHHGGTSVHSARCGVQRRVLRGRSISGRNRVGVRDLPPRGWTWTGCETESVGQLFDHRQPSSHLVRGDRWTGSRPTGGRARAGGHRRAARSRHDRPDRTTFSTGAGWAAVLDAVHRQQGR